MTEEQKIFYEGGPLIYLEHSAVEELTKEELIQRVRRETLLEVVKMVMQRVKLIKSGPKSLFRGGAESALLIFAQELNRMAEEAKS